CAIAEPHPPGPRSPAVIQRVAELGTTPDLDGADLQLAIVVARSNDDVTKRLLRGAQEALQRHGVQDPDVFWVPGPLELPVTALALAEKGGHDAIVCLGCVIRGETFQFEVVASIAHSEPAAVTGGARVGRPTCHATCIELALTDTA